MVEIESSPSLIENHQAPQNGQVLAFAKVIANHGEASAYSFYPAPTCATTDHHVCAVYTLKQLSTIPALTIIICRVSDVEVCLPAQSLLRISPKLRMGRRDRQLQLHACLAFSRPLVTRCYRLWWYHRLRQTDPLRDHTTAGATANTTPAARTRKCSGFSALSEPINNIKRRGDC